ncbi:MAG TPA: methyltransferase domain-containing protein [Mycobacteriales bacterium]
MDYDAELRRFDEVVVPAWGVGPRDRVVDIGCGGGWTTREAARLAVGGSVLGVDVSAAAVARARRVARDEGLPNVAFECGDAQVHPFPEGGFDLAISRFGTMFFADPVAAFGNLGRALRPDGRLVMLVWQARERNEWAVALDRILGGDADSPDAFSLGDPATATAILDAAGFAGVAFTDVRRPVYYGPDVESAVGWVGGFTSTKDALERLDESAAADALGRLAALMAHHLGGDGVWFDSRAWIVRATLRAGSARAESRSGP